MVLSNVVRKCVSSDRKLGRFDIMDCGLIYEQKIEDWISESESLCRGLK